MRNLNFLPWLARLLVLLCVAAMAAGAGAQPAGAIVPSAVLTDGAPSVRVEGAVDLLFELPGESLTRDQVASAAYETRWTRYAGKKINLTRPQRPVWIRFAVRNDAAAARKWVLGIDWPLLDQIDLHRRDPASGAWAESFQAGTNYPDSHRSFKDPAFNFAVNVPSGATSQYVMRVRTTSAFFVPLLISETSEYQARRYDHVIVMGVLFGVLGIMLLYNGALAVFTREKSYGIYALYLLAVLLYELTITGYGELYLWTHNPWLTAHAYELFACASFLAASVFFRYFLDLKHSLRHLRLLNTVVVSYWVIAMVVSAAMPSRLLSASIGLMGMLGGLVGIYTAGVLIARGNVFARYFFMAWLVVIVGTFMSLLSLVGAIEGNWWSNNAQHIGFVLEILLLSTALADRIKRERVVREQAQRESLELTERVKQEREEKIRAQEHAISIQAKANEDLELRVLDRTAELERAMKNLELANVELAKLSVTDALTKVNNRRYFDEVLAKEYDRSERTQVPLAVVMVDIDHFKRVNDTCGHLAGDECLKLVAAALRTTVARSTDLIARYGGEEFALVLPGTDAAHAVELADRVRQAVEKIDFIYRGKRVPISVSLGVVARVADRAQPLTEFLAEADAALYRAKEAGRNRVMLAEAA